MPVKAIAIASGVVIVLLVVAVFWFAGQADSRKPVPVDVRHEATNVKAH